MLAGAQGFNPLTECVQLRASAVLLERAMYSLASRIFSFLYCCAVRHSFPMFVKVPVGTRIGVYDSSPLLNISPLHLLSEQV